MVLVVSGAVAGCAGAGAGSRFQKAVVVEVLVVVVGIGRVVYVVSRVVLSSRREELLLR